MAQASDDIEALRRAKEGESKLRAALAAVLDSKALERLSFMKVSNEALYSQVVSYLFSLYNSGKLSEKVNEDQLKRVASLFLAQKREGKITRLSK